MRRIIFTAALLITFSASARAQEAPLVELSGGYSYFRLDGGSNLHGWNGSIAINPIGALGLVAEFSGHYGPLSRRVDISDDNFPQISPRPGERSSLYLMLFGPRFSYRGNSKITPFTHTLFGASYLRTNATARLGDIVADVPFARGGYSMAIGGGLDVKVSDSVSLRLVQADYLLTNLGSNSQTSLRLSAGIVLH
jgi:opacity protein-like surface antigen